MKSSPKNIIVTAANESYAALVLDLMHSIEPHRAALDIAFACLDIGLSAETILQLENLGVEIRKPEWPFRPHPKFQTDRKFLARAVRPVLRDLYPGYTCYIWLDADAWIQHPVGIHWLVQAVKWSDIAAVPTIHRSYEFKPIDIQWVRKRYEMAFGTEVAEKLSAQPYINSGVFSMPAGSTIWEKFFARFQEALDRWEGDFLSDQAVLNAVVQLDRPRYERLPAKVNWICHLARPRWDQTKRMLVEPSMPFETISIIHNTYNDKAKNVEIASLLGKQHFSALTFSGIKRLRLASAP